MKSIFNKIFLLFLVFITSCEALDLEVEDSPNALRPDQFDINLLLNNVQLGTVGFFQGLTDEGMEVTRMTHMFGPLYQNAYFPETFSGNWSTAYATVLADIRALVPEAEELGAWRHTAVARILESYVIVGLVDFFGDVPYSEALQGANNLNPAADSGEEVYNQALGLLNQALAELDRSTTLSSTDLMFGGNTLANTAKWKKLANSLKLRIFVQKRLVDGNASDSVVAIINSPAGLIESSADDFVFTYGTNLENPASRNPFFGGNYDNGAGDYMSNSYMARFLTSPSGFNDPRLRYYFYRQETNTNSATITQYPCIAFPRPTHYAPTDIFCRIGQGYWGRDHGDDSGIPPDNLLRTIWGVYPVGGQFDANNDTRGRQTSGAGGAGIAPILPSFFVDFLRAEAAITLGTGEDARALLDKGIRASISKCITLARTADPTYTALRFDTDSDGVPDESPQQRFEPDADDIDEYVNVILDSYDAAANNAERLGVVIEEYYKAAFGNGFEAYNMYRRTGFPADLQPTYAVNPGAFIRSFFYPANYVNVNNTASQKPDVDQEVFWDDRSATLR